MENTEQEFVSVVKEYERVIYKVCYLYTTPNATLNDLYQEVVLNLWKAFPKFRKECKISTWIYRIALNTCISFIRKEKNIPEIVSLTYEADRVEESDETQEMLRQRNGLPSGCGVCWRSRGKRVSSISRSSPSALARQSLKM
ncbi:sigma-70 family RNA polymerase sigma factor, partial [Bacteroides heparinolyticus]|uniref:sigma-70 family RNA polymerase sigma factor n=1 Tax=Prevotella heparinolytica TaxID=28113 RepID=UPI0035A15C65